MSLLSVQNVGKSFRGYRSEWQRFARWMGFPIKPSTENWVLRGINFSIKAGESIGIIGQNGAGKSTLLKIITGTLQPSEGQIQVNGRIAAILELGMGFNPDLTGRENAYHGLGLMGFNQAEIEQVMPELEDFAEVGEYFDQPVRVYSSGMQMRVAFAVATAFRPEILIVDEALSVGDSYFQHKSFERILQFKTQGTVLLFVSHGLEGVKTLCDQAVLLSHGEIIKAGLPDEVIDYYNALTAEKENEKLTIEQRREKNGWLLTRSGTGEARIDQIRLLDVKSGQNVAVARVGQQLCLEAKVKIYDSIPRLVLSYMLRDKLGHIVWGTNTWHTKQAIFDCKQGDVIYYKVTFTCTLGQGSYSFTPTLVSTETHLVNNFEWTDNALVFDVINEKYGMFIGSNWLDSKFYISKNGQDFI